MFLTIRDCKLPRKYDPCGAKGASVYIMYHFLRLIGWERIWECDGVDDNHVDDGSMEADNVASWMEGGGHPIPTKVTTGMHMGNQCLALAPTGTGQYLDTDDLTLVSEETYRVDFWLKSEESGVSTEVQVNVGTGSFSTLGTISGSPASGWRRFNYSFTEDQGGATAIRFLNQGSTPTTPILLDSMSVYHSWYEHNGVDQDYLGTGDGEITNGDEFSSTAYTFVVGDIGKHIAVVDTNNLGNSNVYEITSIVAGNAQLDLRAGGSPSLTSQADLPWRLLDTSVAPAPGGLGSSTSERYAGFMLESIHSQKWRIAFRNNTDGGSGNNGWVHHWSCPYDGDFNVETGDFFPYEVSTSNIHGAYAKNVYGANSWPPTRPFIMSGYLADPQSTFMRAYFWTDDTGSFLLPVFRHGDANSIDVNMSMYAGFTGSDSYHTLLESFAHFGGIYGNSGHDLKFDADTRYHWPANGLQCTQGTGWMNRCVIMVLGYSSLGTDVLDSTTYARPNPFDGKYWLLKPRMARDYWGAYTSSPSEKDLEGSPIWLGLPVPGATVFEHLDSNSYIYIGSGIFLENVGGFESLT